jgi:AraC-like DNA-binding protein
MNYTQFVNKHRIDEAMSLIVDKRYQDQNVAEIGDMVGFANRQSFYASFFRFTGITPRQYREDNLQKHPAMVARRK